VFVHETITLQLGVKGMSKVNKTISGKLARERSLHTSGQLVDGAFVPHFQQGHMAYSRGEQRTNLWHIRKSEGWKNALKKDIRFLDQVQEHGGKAHVVASIVLRIERALGLQLKAA